MDLPIFVQNKKVFDDVSLATSQTTEVLEITGLEGYAVHAIFTGSPTGTFKIFGGCSQTASELVEVYSLSVSAATTVLVNVEFARYPYVYITYTRTSGTGNLTTYVSGKL
jgi:hypothetical protein